MEQERARLLLQHAPHLLGHLPPVRRPLYVPTQTYCTTLCLKGMLKIHHKVFRDRAHSAPQSSWLDLEAGVPEGKRGGKERGQGRNGIRKDTHQYPRQLLKMGSRILRIA